MTVFRLADRIPANDTERPVMSISATEYPNTT
jgi:hypothetical protein